MRSAIAIPGGILALITAPILVEQDVPEGLRVWRDWLGRAGGETLQNGVVIGGVVIFLVATVGPRLWTLLWGEATTAASDTQPEHIGYHEGEKRHEEKIEAWVREGWQPTFQSVIEKPFGEGIRFRIQGPRADGFDNLRCAITGPFPERPKAEENQRIIAKAEGLASEEASFHYPGEFNPKPDDATAEGSYVVRWSGHVLDPGGIGLEGTRKPLATLTCNFDAHGAFLPGPLLKLDTGSESAEVAEPQTVYEALTNYMNRFELFETEMRIACQRQWEADSEEGRKALDREIWENFKELYNDLIHYLKRELPSEVNRFVQTFGLAPSPILDCPRGSKIPYWYKKTDEAMQRLESLIKKYDSPAITG